MPIVHIKLKRQMKCVLVYYVDDYPEMGGGLAFNIFENEDVMHEMVNELLKKHGDKFRVTFAASIQKEFKYEAVEVVKEYRVKED